MSTEVLKILGFRHELEIYDKKTGIVISREVKLNRIPQAGIDFLIQAPFGDVAPIPSFYCGLFRNNELPTEGMTASDIPSVLGEFTEYSEATRPEWQRVYNDAGSYYNADAKAEFTATAERDICGSFIVSNPVKGSNSGLLLSVVRFSTVKKISPEHPGRLSVGLTYIPTNIL